MSITVLPPTNDWIFKLLFGDERNKSMLIDLLKSFVDLPEEEYELTFMDPHLKRIAPDDKQGILDVKVKTVSGKIIDIEIQVEPMSHIGRRLSYYKSRLIADQIGKGDEYEKIQRVICVCITSYALFPGAQEYLNGFRFCNRENGLCFADIPEEIYTLELAKVPAISDGSGVWEWLRFLRSRTKEEIEMVTERNPEIRKAADALYELSADAEVRYQYEQREKARRDTVAQADYRWNQERIALEGKIADKDAEIERLRAELQAKSGSPTAP
ncbi:MAG: Rpn family recombination-promoting nuclease/putative transposase [Treponema sp.]|nr:Rpn family recombination-promoting nuclease/putative transposase [Treponema sp.]